MSEPSMSIRSVKRYKTILISAGLLAALVAGKLVLAFVEKVRDASDRAT